MIKNNILVYDITSIPEGLSFPDMIKMYKEEKTVFYDSSDRGSGKPQKPFLTEDTGDIKFVNMNLDEVDDTRTD